MSYEDLRKERYQELRENVKKVRAALLDNKGSAAYVTNQAARLGLEHAFGVIDRGFDDYESMVSKALFFAKLDGEAYVHGVQDKNRLI